MHMDTQRYVVLRDVSRPTLSGRHSEMRVAAAVEPARQPPPPDPTIEIADLSERDVNDLSRDPMVMAAAMTMPIKLIEPIKAATDADPLTQGSTWGIESVGANASGYDGKGIKVAVIDTGIDKDHVAFAGINIHQRDYTGDGPGDTNGHGTHCAGTIFGRAVANTRIGVATGVHDVFIGRVFGNDGKGSGSDAIAEAINDAVEYGCQVVSMSLGFDYPGFLEQLINQYGNDYPKPFLAALALSQYRANVRLFDALGRLMEARSANGPEVILVAASGNESARNEQVPYELPASPPSEAAGFVSVGAVSKGQNGLEVAQFSNTSCNVVGPGVGVLSARAGTADGLVSLSGTSMATPHVAGVAALWLQRISDLPTADSSFPAAGTRGLGRLLGTATHRTLLPGFDPADVGNGLVQAPR